MLIAVLDHLTHLIAMLSTVSNSHSALWLVIFPIVAMPILLKTAAQDYTS